ncbi:hypothetical protein [Flavobacterium sp.]|jgi:Leucine-rich repeat (LRR) protein|uniref:hypothetical protein n=1 Tax=Flavobacterium sp. TaxID=239 RepID=UPI0037C094D7
MEYLTKNKLFKLLLALSLLIIGVVNAQTIKNKKVIVGSEDLSKFYSELSEHHNVQTLYIGFVNYSEIDFAQLQKLKNVKSLSFSFIKKVCMEDFIEKVSTIDQIDSLRLGSSNIKNLPSTLYKLNFLDYLNFANNKIKNIEEQQKQLVVSELDLSDNKIKSADVLGTSSIKRLDLTYNPFSAFPYCLGKVMELEVLQIGNWKKKLKINKGIQGFENLKWLTYLISYDRMNLRNDYFINNTEFQITNFRV